MPDEPNRQHRSKATIAPATISVTSLSIMLGRALAYSAVGSIAFDCGGGWGSLSNSARQALVAQAPGDMWCIHVAYEFRDPLLLTVLESLPADEVVDIVPMYAAQR